MDDLFSNQSTVYLAEPYNGTFITDDCYGGITLEVLTPRGPMNSYNCIMLACNDHPYLRRQYIPSRTYLRQHPNVREDYLWIGVPMECGMQRKATERDWFLTLKHAIEQGNYSISRNPRRGGGWSRTFWMQIRGYFRYSDQTLISAAIVRHLDLLMQLIHYGIIVLNKEKLISIQGGNYTFYWG
ncbi:hypothetical protein N7488_003180 [Penicillium malachiteum]|nr:hypothetical protein N7488_003180 [Penicillium malachiteum]